MCSHPSSKKHQKKGKVDGGYHIFKFFSHNSRAKEYEVEENLPGIGPIGYSENTENESEDGHGSRHLRQRRFTPRKVTLDEFLSILTSEPKSG